jgi:hypothetical protein
VFRPFVVSKRDVREVFGKKCVHSMVKTIGHENKWISGRNKNVILKSLNSVDNVLRYPKAFSKSVS